MEISKNGWLYKVAYALEREENRPEVTNLCRFFWRMVFMLFFWWPIFLVLICVAFLFFFFLGFLIGERPTFFKNDPQNVFFVPYKRWPTIGGERILPIYLILALGAGWLVGCYGWPFVKLLCYGLLNVVGYWLVGYLPITAGFLIGIVGTILLWWLVYKLYNSEFVYLAGKYLLAKKQKICPIIRFTE